ncbi:MAG: DNA mismatch repair protein MutL, partial [Lachnospiraceae bacterium]|nr:DNA mismatch repair protein MutL [Candidatus Equihabitans merdae]
TDHQNHDDVAAIRYRIEGGQEMAMEMIGAPDGTTIIVRDLFYNIPVRAKFLKTAMTEAGYIGTYVEQLALSHPTIAFTYKVNGNVKLSTSGTGKLRDVIYSIYGREIVKNLVDVDLEDEEHGLSVHGYIAKPVISRGNRHFENYYVNGRFVKNNMLSRAIENGFGNKLMNHQYPFACLFVNVRGEKVDVNVHPTKMEVRFTDEPAVYDAVRRSVSAALTNLEMIGLVSLTETVKKEEKKVRHAPEPFETTARIKQALAKQDSDKAEIKNIQAATTQSETKSIQPQDIQPQDNQPAPSVTYKERENRQDMVFEQASFGFLTEEARPKIKLIGQLFKTYWLIQYENSLFIVDQHAAHEKVLYERLIKSYAERKLSSQMISPPMVVTLSSEEVALYETYKDAFTNLGFEIESFGGNDYKISAVPYTLERLGSRSFFKELLDHLEETRRLEDLEVYTKRVATEACKAAVKGHDLLPSSEAEKLIDELMTLEDPYHCPHGRPTIIAFTQAELEKKFKRIV